jgi:uncharacterized protein YjbI with pentapeptide repeats
MGAMGRWDWIGLGERRWKTTPNEQVQPSKTLWDLLQLLIVPVILVGISLWWSATQDSRDKRRADQERQDTTLNDYIQQMSDLMLTNELLSSEPGDPVRSVARTVTLTALRRLGGERKGEVVRFLHEANLIIDFRANSEDVAVVDLDGADLTGADLTGADLLAADLSGADLTGAELDPADLTASDLRFAHLTGADLNGADLLAAVLSGADVTGADLTNAILTDADLTGADLTGADLTGAKLNGAKLDGAKGLPEGIP